MTRVDMRLRTDVLAAGAVFRPAKTEPSWTEQFEPTEHGAYLILYVSEAKVHFGSLGAFWVHALFNFLEDRLQTEALASEVTASLCRQATVGEAFEAIERRLGRPLGDAEREAMGLAEGRPGAQVFEMQASEKHFALLLESESRYVGAFIEGAD